MNGTLPPLAERLAHARELAGVDLLAAGEPGLRVEEARHTVVVLSRSRDPHREVYLDRCEADGVPVVVRPSGGGAVVLCPGVVAASLLAPVEAPAPSPDVCFSRYCGLVARALEECGLPGVVQRGVSDLCFGQRKVAGSSLRLAGSVVLYQVALLVSPDLSLIERYLPMPSRQPAYRKDRSHLEFLTTLREQGFGGSSDLVVEALRRHLAGDSSPAS